MGFSEQWQQWRARVDLDEYDERWNRQQADGASVHGEADFVMNYEGQRVLDAGCGMGRVAIELHRRGRSVVGVDNDGDMLAYAARREPAIQWVVGDLAATDLEQRFDIIVLAGNVLVFAEPRDRGAVVANLAGHLADGGVLISGATYGVDFSAGLTLDSYDQWCAEEGLELATRHATWDGDGFDGGDYAVSVHRRQASPSA